MSSLQRMLSEPVPKAIEKAFLEKLRSKMLAGAAMLVTAIWATRGVYGEEGVETIHRAFRERAVQLGRERARQVNDHSLRAFCSALEAGCAGTHEWIKVEDTDVRQAYRFTRCMWADVFRELDAQDIGSWICEGDGPTAAAFNPTIGFHRTKTLMMGNDCCDHVYYLKDVVRQRPFSSLAAQPQIEGTLDRGCRKKRERG